jgi:hypothetical protein
MLSVPDSVARTKHGMDLFVRTEMFHAGRTWYVRVDTQERMADDRHLRQAPTPQRSIFNHFISQIAILAPHRKKAKQA